MFFTSTVERQSVFPLVMGDRSTLSWPVGSGPTVARRRLHFCFSGMFVVAPNGSSFYFRTKFLGRQVVLCVVTSVLLGMGR